MALHMNVITNNTDATAKILWYANVPAGVSPRLIWTIYEVMVWMGTRGFRVKEGFMPAAIATSMVSPIALDIAKIKAAMIPDTAAGSKMVKATWNREEPRA